ncbi:MAG: hypothetical protein ACTSQI_13360 [Candidatus Helarchaeota archaeon]
MNIFVWVDESFEFRKGRNTTLDWNSDVKIDVRGTKHPPLTEKAKVLRGAFAQMRYEPPVKK